MTSGRNQASDIQRLRKRAEAFANKNSSAIKKMATDDIKILLSELQIYQIELEMQNEELRRAQGELETQRDRYADLYDSAPVGYFTLHDKAFIVEINLTGALMLGARKNLLIGRPFFQFIHEADQDVFYLHIQKLLESESFLSCELRLEKKEGPAFYARLHSITKRPDDDSPPQIRIAVTDISERKRAEQKNRDYQAQLKTLTTELALADEHLKRTVATDLHDRISQSLASAKMGLSSLREEMTDPSQKKKLIEVISALAEILKDSQSIACHLSSPVLNVLGLAKGLDQWLTQEIANKHGLHTHFSDDGLENPLDEDAQAILFRSACEVLHNVVLHAQAHHVKVTVRQIDQDIQILVADDGIGFNPETVSDEGRGGGLLSIQASLERLGGRLEIESEKESGSRIALRVPMTIQEQPEAER
jgi:PAS domain S-box-containing protein